MASLSVSAKSERSVRSPCCAKGGAEACVQWRRRRPLGRLPSRIELLRLSPLWVGDRRPHLPSPRTSMGLGPRGYSTSRSSRQQRGRRPVGRWSPWQGGRAPLAWRVWQRQVVVPSARCSCPAFRVNESPRPDLHSPSCLARPSRCTDTLPCRAAPVGFAPHWPPLKAVSFHHLCTCSSQDCRGRKCTHV